MLSPDVAGIIEYSPDGIAVTDERGVIVLWNSSMEQLTGIPQSAAKQRYLWEVLVSRFPAHARTPEAVAFCWQQIYACLRGASFPLAKTFYEIVVQTPAGHMHKLQLACFSIPVAHGFRAGCICRDITHNNSLPERHRQESEELALINWAALLFTSLLELDEVLAAIQEEVLRLLPATGASIWLREENDPHPALIASTSVTGTPLNQHYAKSFSRTVKWVFQKNQQLNIGDWTVEECDVPRMHSNGEVIRAAAFVPLRIKDQVLGVLNIYATQPNRFFPNDLMLLESLSIPAAVAIRNARLFRRVKEFASARERQHISQQLHDLVNQSLTSVSLITESLPELWQQNPEEGFHALQELQIAVRGALAEQRQALAELRSPDLTSTDLSDLLRGLTEEYARRLNIPIEFEEKGRGEVPSDVQVMFYRIVQEALNNIRKHAQAAHVAVQLSYLGKVVTLCVVDDGVGFDTSQVPQGHYGLQIMQERAESVGARFELTSSHNQGTTILVKWSEEHHAGSGSNR